MLSDSFLQTLKTLKLHEENNLKLESSLSEGKEENLVRKINVMVINNVISLYEDHLKNSATETTKPKPPAKSSPTSSTGTGRRGRPKGSRNNVTNDSGIASVKGDDKEDDKDKNQEGK